MYSKSDPVLFVSLLFSLFGLLFAKQDSKPFPNSKSTFYEKHEKHVFRKARKQVINEVIIIAIIIITP